jgi:hypothetical protein
MTLEINKKAILEEFELNPFKAYANYKTDKFMKSLKDGTYKEPEPEVIPKNAPELAQADTTEQIGTLDHTMGHIHNYNSALSDAMKMLGH